MQFKLLFIFSTKTYGLVLKRIISMGRFFCAPKTNVKIDVKEIFHNFKTNIYSSPELKAHGRANSIPVALSVIRPQHPFVLQHFQTSSPLKPLDQFNSYFI